MGWFTRRFPERPVSARGARSSGATRILCGMTTSPEPLDVVRADAERWLMKRAQNVAWWARKRIGLPLIAAIVNASATVGLLFAVAPFAVSAAVAVVFAVMATYLVGLRRKYDNLETVTRWGISREIRRLQRELLKSELALRQATLVLAGDPRDRQEQFRMHAPGTADFVKVLRYDLRRRAEAAAERRPQPPRAHVRKAAAAQRPDVASVRRRRDLILRELALLKEQDQACGVPQDRQRAEFVAEQRKVLKNERAAAHAEDRAARDRARRGLPPVAPDAALTIDATTAPGSARRVQAVAAVPATAESAGGTRG